MPDRPSSLPTASSAPTDAYERSAQTYPVLSEAMTDRIARFGEAELVADGALLFERGERSVDFFLVRSGAVGILDHGADSSTTPTSSRASWTSSTIAKSWCPVAPTATRPWCACPAPPSAR